MTHEACGRLALCWVRDYGGAIGTCVKMLTLGDTTKVLAAVPGRSGEFRNSGNDNF